VEGGVGEVGRVWVREVWGWFVWFIQVRYPRRSPQFISFPSLGGRAFHKFPISFRIVQPGFLRHC